MSEDLMLKWRVTDELPWDARIDETHTRVTVHDGAVTLSGHVASFPERYAALEAARRTRGVLAIADDVEVRLPPDRFAKDDGLAERIAHVPEWNVSVPEGAIQAEVSSGFVTLTGTVDWRHERRPIEDQVRHVGGVKGIVDSIAIRQRAVPSDIKRRIEEALERQADVEARGVSVEVDGDRVMLEGRVKAFHERGAIERAVWAAPGVREVVDHLRVT